MARIYTVGPALYRHVSGTADEVKAALQAAADNQPVEMTMTHDNVAGQLVFAPLALVGR